MDSFEFSVYKCGISGHSSAPMHLYGHLVIILVSVHTDKTILNFVIENQICNYTSF